MIRAQARRSEARGLRASPRSRSGNRNKDKPMRTRLLRRLCQEGMLIRTAPIGVLLVPCLVAAGRAHIQGDTQQPPPLISAAAEGDSQLITRLLRKGANPDIEFQGHTPLMWAAYNGHTEAAKALTLGGARIDYVGKFGDTALRCSVASNNDVLNYLISIGADPVAGADVAGNNVLHVAARVGNSSAVETLTSAFPALISSRNMRDETALHLAAANGHTECLELLMNRGASIGARAVFSRTALHYASFYGRVQAVTMLISLGADPNAVDDLDRDALTLGVSSGSLDTCRMLIQETRLRVSAVGETTAGRYLPLSPFHFAALMGRADLLEVLFLDQRSRSTHNILGLPLAEMMALGNCSVSRIAALSVVAEQEQATGGVFNLEKIRLLSSNWKRINREKLPDKGRSPESEELLILVHQESKADIPLVLFLHEWGWRAIPQSVSRLVLWPDGAVVFSAGRGADLQRRIGFVSGERIRAVRSFADALCIGRLNRAAFTELHAPVMTLGFRNNSGVVRVDWSAGEARSDDGQVALDVLRDTLLRDLRILDNVLALSLPESSITVEDAGLTRFRDYNFGSPALLPW